MNPGIPRGHGHYIWISMDICFTAGLDYMYGMTFENQLWLVWEVVELQFLFIWWATWGNSQSSWSLFICWRLRLLSLLLLVEKKQKEKEKRWTESSVWGKMIQIEILDIILFCDLQRILLCGWHHTYTVDITWPPRILSLSLSLSEFVCICVATMKSVRFENQKATWFFFQSISPFFLETNGDFMLFIV